MKYITGILLLSGLILCSHPTVFSQNFYWEALDEHSNRLPGKLSGKVFYLAKSGNSNHFYHSEWHDGSVLLEDGDLFEGVQLRYLAYGDELIVYNPALSQLFTVDKETVAEFQVNALWGTQKFVKVYFDGLLSGDRYFELLHDGARQLLAYRFIERLKTSIYKDHLGRLKDSQFKLKTNYYIYSPESGFRKVSPRRKSVLSLFPDRKKELRRMMRQIDVSVKNETGLVKIVGLMEEEGFFF